MTIELKMTSHVYSCSYTDMDFPVIGFTTFFFQSYALGFMDFDFGLDVLHNIFTSLSVLVSGLCTIYHSCYFIFSRHLPRAWYLYRVSQKECARLWEGVSYVKVCRYNPKRQCPKLNGYGDNGERNLKLWHLLSTKYVLKLAGICGFCNVNNVRNVKVTCEWHSH
jgi:hypothetical protein